MYNCHATGNPFGFSDISSMSNAIKNNRQRAFDRTTSKKGVRKCLKKKLTAKNVKFLQSLGLAVKKR